MKASTRTTRRMPAAAPRKDARRKPAARPAPQAREWFIKVNDAPDYPCVRITRRTPRSQVAAAFDALGHDVAGLRKIVDMETILLRSDGEAQMASSALVLRRISHDAFFRVGGIWVMQSLVFNAQQSRPSAIVWPCAEKITLARIRAMLLGRPIPGLQATARAILEGGGYLAIDLARIGVALRDRRTDSVFIGSKGEPPWAGTGSSFLVAGNCHGAPH